MQCPISNAAVSFGSGPAAHLCTMLGNMQTLTVISPSLRCWVISDGAAGNESQAQALALAMHTEPKLLRIALRKPWAWLAPRFTLMSRLAVLGESRSELAPPWPDIAIGCGRHAALITRLLRPWSAGRTFTVQILDPRIGPENFDVVVAPRHDGLTAGNVIATTGSLNRIDDAWLAHAAKQFAELAQLPQPRVAVLIGASHRSQVLDDDYFSALLQHLSLMHACRGGSFLVTTSRRTPHALAARLRSSFAAWPGRFYSGPQDGENPYPGFLGFADRIIVTPDSVNMLSEACATGKPVSTYVSQPLKGKIAAFHRTLTATGFLQPLDLSNPTSAPAALRETPAVAAEVLRRADLFFKNGGPTP